MSRTTAYKELEEIEAPAAIEEIGGEAGDRGMLVMLLERPKPAPMVEYADGEGQTKALVVYSSDLEQIFKLVPATG